MTSADVRELNRLADAEVARWAESPPSFYPKGRKIEWDGFKLMPATPSRERYALGYFTTFGVAYKPESRAFSGGHTAARCSVEVEEDDFVTAKLENALMALGDLLERDAEPVEATR